MGKKAKSFQCIEVMHTQTQNNAPGKVTVVHTHALGHFPLYRIVHGFTSFFHAPSTSPASHVAL